MSQHLKTLFGIQGMSKRSNPRSNRPETPEISMTQEEMVDKISWADSPIKQNSTKTSRHSLSDSLIPSLLSTVTTQITSGLRSPLISGSEENNSPTAKSALLEIMNMMKSRDENSSYEEVEENTAKKRKLQENQDLNEVHPPRGLPDSNSDQDAELFLLLDQAEQTAIEKVQSANTLNRPLHNLANGKENMISVVAKTCINPLKSSNVSTPNHSKQHDRNSGLNTQFPAPSKIVPQCGHLSQTKSSNAIPKFQNTTMPIKNCLLPMKKSGVSAVPLQASPKELLNFACPHIQALPVQQSPIKTSNDSQFDWEGNLDILDKMEKEAQSKFQNTQKANTLDALTDDSPTGLRESAVAQQPAARNKTSNVTTSSSSVTQGKVSIYPHSNPMLATLRPTYNQGRNMTMTTVHQIPNSQTPILTPSSIYDSKVKMNNSCVGNLATPRSADSKAFPQSASTLLGTSSQAIIKNNDTPYSYPKYTGSVKSMLSSAAGAQKAAVTASGSDDTKTIQYPPPTQYYPPRYPPPMQAPIQQAPPQQAPHRQNSMPESYSSSTKCKEQTHQNHPQTPHSHYKPPPPLHGINRVNVNHASHHTSHNAPQIQFLQNTTTTSGHVSQPQFKPPVPHAQNPTNTGSFHQHSNLSTSSRPVVPVVVPNITTNRYIALDVTDHPNGHHAPSKEVRCYTQTEKPSSSQPTSMSPDNANTLPAPVISVSPTVGPTHHAVPPPFPPPNIVAFDAGRNITKIQPTGSITFETHSGER